MVLITQIPELTEFSATYKASLILINTYRATGIYEEHSIFEGSYNTIHLLIKDVNGNELTFIKP
jgi:hypothetical protein